MSPLEGRLNDPSRAQIWAMFMAALAPRLGNEGAVSIGKAADDLMHEYDERWTKRQVVA
jgi:hypothetical protein